jgi:glycosyltransferase involved in cell wall biosynthesis
MKTSNQNLNLLWLTPHGSLPEWDLGSAYLCDPSPADISECLETYLEDAASAWLIWDPAAGLLEPEFYQALLAGPADVWHAGLNLGLRGQPAWIDFVSPTWMLNRDPDPDIQASSWRLSLRACLIRAEVLRQLGCPDPYFESLDVAGLALGFRYIRQGAFVQHVPGMAMQSHGLRPATIPLKDQVRFIKSGYGKQWAIWAGFRAAISGSHPPVAILRAIQQDFKQPTAIPPTTYQRSSSSPNPPFPDGQVTVLIPTVNRYPFLRTLLNQLRHQTVTPLEIIVIDQTQESRRDLTIIGEFFDLPIHWITLEHIGQCSSRNTGLLRSKGDYILFLDDDVEIPSDLIEIHLKNLVNFYCQVSSGVVYEIDNKLPTKYENHTQISDVFPAGNSLIMKRILVKTGLFDLAYDHGQSADRDLGMRIYLSGFKSILDPTINILHHRAKVGGLREHNARVNTYSRSRNDILKLNLPTISDIYFAKRYFSTRQVREMLWISVLGTFSVRGKWWKRSLKTLISTLRLPCTIWQIHKRLKQAEVLLKHYPQIPHLEEP